MTTAVDQLYGPNHWDEINYNSMYNYYLDKKWSKGLEIGFAWSMSCQAFLNTQPGATLLSLDMNDAMNRADEMKSLFGDRWSIEYGDSSTLMSELEDTYDYIYIDGDHTYEGVKKDLWEAPRLLNEDGVIICDDYGNAQSIRDAVADFCTEFGFRIVESIPGNGNGAVVLERNR